MDCEEQDAECAIGEGSCGLNEGGLSSYCILLFKTADDSVLLPQTLNSIQEQNRDEMI